MAGKVVGWAFEIGRTEELPATQRFVLVAYADNASEKEGKCWPEKTEIVEKTGLSRATVYRAVRTLESKGHLSETTDAKGRECLFLAVPWASHCETDESQGETRAAEALSQPETGKSQGENPESHSETSTNKGTVKNRQEPSHTVWGKVGGKKVTEPEFTLAAEIADAFNAAAGTGYSARAHLTPIVGRIREHPDLDADAHRAIIAAVFAVPWWDGRPGPQVIYGSSAQFERSLETSRDPAAKRHLQSVKPAADLAEFGADRKDADSWWPAITERIQAKVPDSTYQLWIEPLVPLGAKDSVLLLGAPAGVRTWVERRYLPLILAAAKQVGVPWNEVFFTSVEDGRAAA